MKQIRAAAERQVNEFQEFISFFDFGGKKATLKISSETDYCAYVNGNVAGYGQYEDLPDYKVYDEIDITPFIKKGRNVLAIRAFFEHTDNAHYMEKGCGLAFEVSDGGNVLCESCADTLSRVSPTYKGGEDMPFITGQLGRTYLYDFRAEDGFENGGNTDTFAPSEVLRTEVKLFPRPIAKLVEKKNTAYIIRSGEYAFDGKYGTAAEKMQYAEIVGKEENFTLPSKNGVNLKNKKNIYLLADMRDEKTGVLTFDIEVPADCYMAVGYGEHIIDGRVRSYVGGRHFQFEFMLKKGRNRFIGPFRRLGMRYMSLFLETPEAKIYDFNLISTDYPVAEKPKKFADKRLQEIYDASVKTLKVCMHEHYEDTPWREQALYAMDSRNQMLCGYYAFEDFAFARASLNLMSKNIRDDDVFTITTPSMRDVMNINIPSFSLVQFCAMEDYMNYSGDKSLFAEYENNYRRVIGKFIALREDNGLIKPLSGRKYWNFYEWIDELDASAHFGTPEQPDRYDAPLSAFFAMAVKSMVNMLKSIDRYNGEYDAVLSEATAAVDKFFDKEKNRFADFMETDGRLWHYSELTNSLCALVSGNKAYVSAALELLSGENDLLHITLSHSIFKFSALLTAGGKYNGFIVSEIKRIWGKMLGEGASTFYEDELGAAAFADAGSLSHGWSAVPVYILNKAGY